MLKREMQRYAALNGLAEKDGTVILGGSADREIPLCELKQAFALNVDLYNRSISDLSVRTAIEAYDACVAPLAPESVLLHIGAADTEFFAEHPADFDQKYRELIEHIKAVDSKCSIVIIALRNPEEATDIAEMNKHLRYIAESEHCEYGDIAAKRIWNPKETKDVVSFVYSTGFVRPLKNKRPIYDLVKILFCSEPTYAI